MPVIDAVNFVEQFLTERHIPHVFVGGIAVSSVAQPRATQDADILLGLDLNSAAELVDELESAGASIYKKGWTIQKLKEGRPAKFPWNRKISFDLRLATYTLDFNAIERAGPARVSQYNKAGIPTATVEDLIVYKLARFDKLDQYDIETMMKYRPDVDVLYIQEQAAILSYEAALPQILERLKEILPFA